MVTSETLKPIRRALLSVTDKSGLIDFAQALARQPDDVKVVIEISQ